MCSATIADHSASLRVVDDPVVVGLEHGVTSTALELACIVIASLEDSARSSFVIVVAPETSSPCFIIFFQTGGNFSFSWPCVR